MPVDRYILYLRIIPLVQRMVTISEVIFLQYHRNAC